MQIPQMGIAVFHTDRHEEANDRILKLRCKSTPQPPAVSTILAYLFCHLRPPKPLCHIANSVFTIADPALLTCIVSAASYTIACKRRKQWYLLNAVLVIGIVTHECEQS